MAVQHYQQQPIPRPPSGCGFCKRNKEPESVYSTHQLKDANGQVTCPQLFKYRCELCGSTGKEAHTRSYCPQVSSLRNQFSSRNITRTNHETFMRTNAPAFSNACRSQEEPQSARQDGQVIRLATGRQFRNMSRVTNSKYNSAGRLRFSANNNK